MGTFAKAALGTFVVMTGLAVISVEITKHRMKVAKKAPAEKAKS